MAEENENENKDDDGGKKERGLFASLTKQITKSFAKTFKIEDPMADAKKEILKLGKKTEFTRKVIEANRAKLEAAAETDEKAAAALEKFNDTNFKRIDKLISSIENGDAVSAKQGLKALKSLEDMEKSLDTLGKLDGLEVNGSQILATAKSSLANDALDQEEKRKIFEDMANFLSDQKDLDEVQQASLDEMNKLQKEGLNFTEEQTGRINAVFRNLEGTKIQELKSRGTLEQIDSKMGSLLVSSDELKQTLEETRLDGKSLKDILSEGLESELGSGVIDLIFGSLGLPGIGTVLSGVGAAVTKAIGVIKGVPAFFSKVFKPVGKALKAGGKILKVAGKFTKAIPIVGTIIAAAFAIFDGISGFFNAADISGKAEETLTLGDKIQSGIANILSGIASIGTFFFDILEFFGIMDSDTVQNIKDAVSPQNIFKKIDELKEGISNIFNSVVDGITSFIDGVRLGISNAVDSVTDGISNIVDGIKNFFIGEDGIFTTIGNFFSNLEAKDFINLLPFPLNKLGMKLLDTLGGEDSVKPKEDEKGFFDRAASFFGGDEEKKVEAEEETLTPAQAEFMNAPAFVSPVANTLGQESSIQLQKEEIDKRREVQSQPQVPQVVPVAVEGGTVAKTSRRETRVDDMSLSAINLSLLD